MDDAQRYFMVHIRKAGGTALRSGFKGLFGADGLYPNPAEGFMGLTDLELLQQRWPVRRDEIRVVMGHLPLCTVEMLDTSFVTMTMLRHPVDRTLSYLRMQKARNPDDEDRSLDEVYDAQPRFDTTIHNHMTRMFGITLDVALAGESALTVIDQTPDLLRRAKQNLASVDEIGLYDHYPDFLERLADRHGLILGEVERRNAVLPRNRVEGSPELARRIEADHQMDLELYEYAQELVARRR